MANFKRIFLILFLASFLLFIFSTFIFAQKTELEYPQVSGAETPTTVKTAFPEYVKYLFNLAIIIAGLIAFASLVYGGFSYLTSAGDPTAIGDAKDRITAGILGLIILLASFLILTTINPQLVGLKITPEQFQKGAILYASASCPGSTNPQGEEGKDFLRVRRSLSSLEDFNDKTQSIYFYNSGDEMEVYIYEDEGFKPEDSPPFYMSKDHKSGDCASVSAPPGKGKSIQLYWKTPGVYLYETENCQTPPNPHLFVADSADFTGFHDKIQSIKIVPWIKTETKCDLTKCPGATPDRCLTDKSCQKIIETVVAKYGAILHEQSDFRGDAEVFLGGAPDQLSATCINLPMEEGQGVCDPNTSEPYCREHVRKRVSSINLFKQNLCLVFTPGGCELPTGEGVTLYANYDFNGESDPKDDNKKCGPFFAEKPYWVTGNSAQFGDGCAYVLGQQKGSSISINGDYIAVLFKEDGRGEVFKAPGDLRLRDNEIGDDAASYMLVIPVAHE